MTNAVDVAKGVLTVGTIGALILAAGGPRFASPARPNRLPGVIASKAVRRVVTSALGCAAVLGVGCASGSPHGGSVWDRQMRLGVESVDRGDPRAGVAHYEQALEAAREEPGKPNHLAYANWHLGDACFRYPESCASGEAEQKTQISLALFADLYGPEHPVVIPILLRLSDINTQRAFMFWVGTTVALRERIKNRFDILFGNSDAGIGDLAN